MSIVDIFIKRYTKEYDYFQEASRICAQQCETILQRSGIRAIVTHRAKRPDRLYSKIQKRDEQKKYKRVEDIYSDIVDLAGVRIAIYFPGDREEVNKFIETNFDVVKKKVFPEASKPSYEKRFSGYWATHYRVYLKDDSLSDTNKRYRDAMIEIQVASVLMHAWAEVEHDLVYKPLSGSLSNEEYAILDELNGLVLAGEIALERLQNAVKVRVGELGKKFNNHYELSAYLYACTKSLFEKDTEPVMGRADILYKFLRMANMDRPECLREYIINLDPDTEKRPLIDQIVDRILTGDAELYNLYNKARYDIGAMSPYNLKQEKLLNSSKDQEALGYFLARWIVFEKIIRDISEKRDIRTNRSPMMFTKFDLLRLNLIDENLAFEIDSIRRLRNQVVHGIDFPDKETLFGSGKFLENVLLQISERVEPELSDIINNALSNIA